MQSAAAQAEASIGLTECAEYMLPCTSSPAVAEEEAGVAEESVGVQSAGGRVAGASDVSSPERDGGEAEAAEAGVEEKEVVAGLTDDDATEELVTKTPRGGCSYTVKLLFNIELGSWLD